MSIVRVEVNPPTPANLRKFSKILSDMADAIEAGDHLSTPTPPAVDSDVLREALQRIASGEAFRVQRFAEDDDADYFLRVQRQVQLSAREALSSPQVSGI